MAPAAKKVFYALLGALLVGSVLLGILWNRRTDGRYDQHIRVAAQRYGIEPALIKAVIWRESRFQAGVRGRAGEIGLMQVREDAAFEWADAEKLHPFDHEQITDPEKNILCGSHYLAKLLKRYQKTDNPVPYALADYNAGRSHVLRWNKGAARTNSEAFLAQMDFPGTREYALSVMRQYEYYQRRMKRSGSRP